MIRNRSTRLTDIPPRFEINVYDLGRLRSFSTHTLRANVSYWIQIWESTRRKVMMGGVSIGALLLPSTDTLKTIERAMYSV